MCPCTPPQFSIALFTLGCAETLRMPHGPGNRSPKESASSAKTAGVQNKGPQASQCVVNDNVDRRIKRRIV